MATIDMGKFHCSGIDTTTGIEWSIAFPFYARGDETTPSKLIEFLEAMMTWEEGRDEQRLTNLKSPKPLVEGM